MSKPNRRRIELAEISRSSVVYGASKQDIPKIQKAMDLTFSGYSFYPEVDWNSYGYRPPEGCQILGAWRHPNTKVFAFLLDNPTMITIAPAIQLLLYAVGESSEIAKLEPRLAILKADFALQDRKTRSDMAIGKRLGRVNEKRHFAVLTSVLTIITLILNGFSLYLRQLPPPQFSSAVVANMYSTTIALVHFSALLLLILVAVIAGAFLIKYSILMLRNL